jgi:fatty acid desaturase
MKTGMGNGLILIMILVALGIAMSVLQAQQVEMATAQVQASTAAAQMPFVEALAGQLGGWLLKTAIGVVIVGVAGLAVAFLRSKMRFNKRAWRSGPNAQWQPKEPRERGLTTNDILKFMMMQNGKNDVRVVRPPQKNADQPRIWK